MDSESNDKTCCRCAYVVSERSFYKFYKQGKTIHLHAVQCVLSVNDYEFTE